MAKIAYIFLFFIYAIAIVTVVAGENAESSIMGELTGAVGEIGKSANNGVKKHINQLGKAGSKGVGAATAAVGYVIDESGDNLERVGHVFSKTLPEYSTKLKDGIADVGSAALKTSVNTVTRTMSGLGEVIKASDELGEVGLTQFKKIAEGAKDIAKAAIEVKGTAGHKAGQVGKTVLNGVEKVIDDPVGQVTRAASAVSDTASKLNPTDHVTAAAAYLNPIPPVTAAVSAVSDVASKINPIDHVTAAASYLNPIPPVKAVASAVTDVASKLKLNPFSWW